MTPPRKPLGGVVEGSMCQPSTTLVCTQGKELGCTVAQASVLQAQLADSCQPEMISCILVEEFQDLPTPGEFLDLGLVDAIGGRKNWENVIHDPWVLSVVKNGYQIEWVQKPVKLRPPVQPTFYCKLNALVDLEVKEMLGKGAIITAQPVQGQYISTLFLVEKQGRGSRPVINLKRLNHLVKIRTLPNGRFPIGDTLQFSPGGRVSVQARPQGCILYDTNASEGSQVFAFSMEGEAVRVPGASFRPLFSPKSVHLGYENADSFFKKACFQKRGVPRRCLSHQFRVNGPIKDAGHSMVSVQVGLHYKLEEIVSSPHSERGVSGVCDRYDPTDNHSPTREGFQDHSSVCGSIGEGVLLSQDVSVPHREVAKCINSNFACTTALQVHADFEYQGSGSKPSEIREISGSDGPRSRRAEMVDKKSQVMERQIFY